MASALAVSTGCLLDERDAALILGCSPALLRKWRLVGGGPVFCRIGRLVRYPEPQLQAFIQANLATSVGGQPNAA
jgi:hypothetical protein